MLVLACKSMPHCIATWEGGLDVAHNRREMLEVLQADIGQLICKAFDECWLAAIIHILRECTVHDDGCCKHRIHNQPLQAANVAVFAVTGAQKCEEKSKGCL